MTIDLGSDLRYLVCFLGAFAVTLAVTPIAQRAAIRFDVFDHPTVADHKSHDSPVPYLGGLAIVAAFAVSLYFAFGGMYELFAILIAATGLSVVGFVDDHRTLGPGVKFGAQVLAALVVWSFGTRILLFHIPVLDLALTVFWIVGITNSFNLLDNMDGLSAGVAAIAAAFFWVLAAYNGQYLVGTLAVVLCGACLAFLIYNFDPARIYMGDAGALFLGFMLAVIGVRLKFTNTNTITWGVPLLILGYPIFDTTLVTFCRKWHGLPASRGGRDHSSHRLVRMGLSKRHAVLALYLVTASLGFLALVLSTSTWMQALGILGAASGLALTAGFMFFSVDVYGDAGRRHPKAPGPAK